MVRLDNIHRINDRVMCNAYIEDSSEPVSLILDLDTGTVEDFQWPKGYERHWKHIGKAVYYLLNHAECLPEKHIIMWY